MNKALLVALLMATPAIAHDEGFRWGFGGRAGIAGFNGNVCQRLVLYAGNTQNALQTAKYTWFDQQSNNAAGATSFQGGAFIEAAYRSCNWSFGALIDVNGDTLKKKYTSTFQQPYIPVFAVNGGNVVLTGNSFTYDPTDANTFMSQFKAPIHIGGDIRAGRYFDNALWYGLVGVEGIRIQEVSYVSINSLVDNLNPSITANNGNDVYAESEPAAAIIIGSPCFQKNNCNTNSFWRAALRVGTGVEYAWSDCVSFKLEYRYLWSSRKALCPVYTTQDQAVTILDAQNTAMASLNNAGTIYLSGYLQDTFYFRQQVTSIMLSYQF